MEPPYRPLHDYSPSDIDGIIDMNLSFTAHLTVSVLPLFYRHQKPALIINIGSMAEIGLPWICMYSGPKAGLISWSTALSREMKMEGKHVEVLGIVPGTLTNVSFRKRSPNFAEPDAKAFARSSLRKVGCGVNVVHGWWVHAMTGAVMQVLP
jgi:17beta-estradiol 17-dehydrogenase / very-long-chain 3-oxoacyl-CoA reductase